MTFQSSAPVHAPLAHQDLADYGVARLRDDAFDAVLALWRRRQAEGWTQKRVADRIGRDPAWVNRTLRAPGNWTLRTIGELVQGLEGEAEISVAALEDPFQPTSNHAGYDAYDGYRPRPQTRAAIGFVGSVAISNPGMTGININQPVYEWRTIENSSSYLSRGIKL